MRRWSIEKKVTIGAIVALLLFLSSMVATWTRVTDHVSSPEPHVEQGEFVSQEQWREMREDVLYIRERVDEIADGK